MRLSCLHKVQLKVEAIARQERLGACIDRPPQLAPSEVISCRLGYDAAVIDLKKHKFV